MKRLNIVEQARNAYRFLFELQSCIRTIALYIKDEIRPKGFAGKQLFSDKVEILKPYVGNWASDKFEADKWIWDLFPSYMYAYCYALEDSEWFFDMIVVMDDGSKNYESRGCPEPKLFADVSDSQSYYLFALVKDSPEITKAEIFDIADEIGFSDKVPYTVNKREHTFYFWKYPMDILTSPKDVDDVLDKCNVYAKKNLGFGLKPEL